MIDRHVCSKNIERTHLRTSGNHYSRDFCRPTSSWAVPSIRRTRRREVFCPLSLWPPAIPLTRRYGIHKSTICLESVTIHDDVRSFRYLSWARDNLQTDTVRDERQAQDENCTHRSLWVLTVVLFFIFFYCSFIQISRAIRMYYLSSCVFFCSSFFFSPTRFTAHSTINSSLLLFFAHWWTKRI